MEKHCIQGAKSRKELKRDLVARLRAERERREIQGAWDTCEHETLAQRRRQMCEAETGESEGQPPWAAPGLHLNQPWKREALMWTGERRGRGRSGKLTKRNMYALVRQLLYNTKNPSINLMEQDFLPDLMIRLKDGAGRGGVSQSDPGSSPFHHQAISNKATR